MSSDDLPSPEAVGSSQDASRKPTGREPPRLGIFHLLVWTACVALYLGLSRMIADVVATHIAHVPLPPVTTQGLLARMFHGIGSGTALAGLLLFATRPSRGFRFPVHPGEYLWILAGFGVAIQLVDVMLTAIGIGLFSGRPQFHTWVLVPFFWLAAAAHILIWAWVILRVRQRRWRNFFATLITSNVIAFAAVYFSTPLAPRHALIANMALRLAVDAVLVVVFLQDLVGGKRFPWTHWVGVATRLWFTAGAVAWGLQHFLGR